MSTTTELGFLRTSIDQCLLAGTATFPSQGHPLVSPSLTTYLCASNHLCLRIKPSPGNCLKPNKTKQNITTPTPTPHQHTTPTHHINIPTSTPHQHKTKKGNKGEGTKKKRERTDLDWTEEGEGRRRRDGGLVAFDDGKKTRFGEITQKHYLQSFKADSQEHSSLMTLHWSLSTLSNSTMAQPAELMIHPESRGMQ